MLSKTKISLIRTLATKKGRERSGKCLVEGQKLIDAAGDRVDFTFTRGEVDDFDALVTTETPQDIAGVADLPEWDESAIADRATVVVLDGVQDPGNVGAILRLCLAFGASLMAVDSVDLTNPKVIRASAGAVFNVPATAVSRTDAPDAIARLGRPVYRMERGGQDTVRLDRDGAGSLPPRCAFILGSEGSGITLPVHGTSLEIPHDEDLESLNVGHAAAIILYAHAMTR